MLAVDAVGLVAVLGAAAVFGADVFFLLVGRPALERTRTRPRRDHGSHP